MAIKIMLDPGHGQGKAHNRGYIGGNEGDSNYAFSLMLAEELKKYGFIVGTTRSKPSDDPSLQTRGQMARGCDLFLSLHSNAGGGTGTEIFDDVNTSNKVLATKLSSAIANSLGISNRGVKYLKSGSGNYYGVLRHNLGTSDMLVEHFFHDNKNDVTAWKTRNRNTAIAMARIIAEHYKVATNVVVDTKPVVPTSTGIDGLYRVCISHGLIGRIESARKEVDKYANVGAYYVLEQGKFNVYVGAYKQLDNAINKAKELQEKQIDSTIRLNNNVVKEYKYTHEQIINGAEDEVLILASPSVVEYQMKAWAKSKNAPYDFVNLAGLYYRLASEIGIDPAIAYAQFAKETGYLYKNGSAAGLDETYCNPCGLKIPQGGGDYDKNAHMRFKSWEDGIMAQLDHLALYAGKEGYPKATTNDPRHFPYLKGTAKTVIELGSKWATSDKYGIELMTMVKEMRSFANVDDIDNPKELITAYQDVDFRIGCVVSDQLGIPVVSIKNEAIDLNKYRVIHIGNKQGSKADVVIMGENRYETLTKAMEFIKQRKEVK